VRLGPEPLPAAVRLGKVITAVVTASSRIAIAPRFLMAHEWAGPHQGSPRWWLIHPLVGLRAGDPQWHRRPPLVARSVAASPYFALSGVEREKEKGRQKCGHLSILFNRNRRTAVRSRWMGNIARDPFLAHGSPGLGPHHGLAHKGGTHMHWEGHEPFY
jgi:hypothetical protein